MTPIDVLLTRFETPDDVRAHLRLPTLGVVPDFARLPAPSDGVVGRLLPGRADGRPIAGAAAAAVRTEAFRSIRTSVLFCNAERPPRLLLVTSSQPQEGKTSTTVNLALSLSQLAQAVGILPHVRHGDLMGAPVALDFPSVHLRGAGPALGGAEHDQGPARAGGRPGGARVLADLPDLRHAMQLQLPPGICSPIEPNSILATRRMVLQMKVAADANPPLCKKVANLDLPGA